MFLVIEKNKRCKLQRVILLNLIIVKTVDNNRSYVINNKIGIKYKSFFYYTK